MEEGAEGGEQGQAGSSDDDLTPVAAGDGEDNRSTGSSLGDVRATRRRPASPYPVVTVVALWLCRSFWFPGRYVVGFDTYAYSGPNLEVTERAVRDLRLPILDDMIFGGVPHLGNPSAAALYPPQLLTLLFETNRAMGILVTVHVVLLGVGMVLLLRRLGVGRLGAGVAAVALVASGAALTKTIQFEQILVIAWAPLLIASIHSVLHASRPWRSVAATSAVTAAILLAGHPQHVYQTVILALGATVGFAVGGDRWRRLAHLTLGAMLGALIAAPQLVAVLAATADSALRGGRTIEDLIQPALSLQPSASARALLGTVQDVDPAFFVGSFESIAFVGVTVAILALIGLGDAITDRRRRPWMISFAVVGLVALVWALGPRTFVFDLAFDLLPVFDLARVSARWLVVVVFVAAVFAGIGIDAVARRSSVMQVAAGGVGVAAVGLVLLSGRVVADGRTILLWSVFAAVVIGLVGVNVVAGRGTDRTERSRHRRSVGATIALVAVGALELMLMSIHSLPQSLATDQPFTAYSSPAVEFLAAHGSSTIALTDDGRDPAYEIPAFRPNANALAGVPSIDGYDGGVQITERWATALQRFTPDPPTDLPLRNSLQLPITTSVMARLGVRYVLLDRDRPAEEFIPGWTGPLASSDELDVWENPAWLGEAVAWKQAIEVADPVETAALLRTDADGVHGVAVVDALDAELSCTDATADCEPVGVTFDPVSPEHLVVRTDLDGASVVSVARQALPGWEVDVDGESAEVRTVDGLFLGVEVPPGEHTLTWRYHSPWLIPSLVLSLIGLAATIALAFADTFIRRAEVLK